MPKPALLIAALMILAPLGAASLTPAPQCAVDPDTGTIHPLFEPRGTEIVWPFRFPGGMVMFEWRDDARDRWQGVLQHCPSGTSLRFAVPLHRADALRERLEAMLTSDVVYGFDDVRQEVRLAGGRARMVPSPGGCACEAVSGY